MYEVIAEQNNSFKMSAEEDGIWLHLRIKPDLNDREWNNFGKTIYRIIAEHKEKEV